MPGWNQILEEAGRAPSIWDAYRRNFLARLSNLTGRNAIIYYSAWLQKPGLINEPHADFYVNDDDKDGFMAAVKDLEKPKGLDLILHTPGGDIAATESIIDYLRQIFGNNIRAIVPNLAMSAGTVIALACDKIVMGKHSSLGPIDPRLGSYGAHSILEEFRTAAREIKKDRSKSYVWQPILSKYPATLIGECKKAIKWTNEIVEENLVTGMFRKNPDPRKLAKKVIRGLGSPQVTKSHSRHISKARAIKLKLTVESLEDTNYQDKGDFQDAVLSVHHSIRLTFMNSGAYKIIENQNGVAVVNVIQQRVG